MKAWQIVLLPVLLALTVASCGKKESNNPNPNPTGSAPLSATLSGAHTMNFSSPMSILGEQDSTSEYSFQGYCRQGADSAIINMVLKLHSAGRAGTFPIVSSSDRDTTQDQAVAVVEFVGSVFELYDANTGSGSLVITSVGSKWTGTFQFAATNLVTHAGLTVANGAFNLSLIHI
jgi:hypothetical protein